MFSHNFVLIATFFIPQVSNPEIGNQTRSGNRSGNPIQELFTPNNLKLIRHLKAWNDRMKEIKTVLLEGEHVSTDLVLKRQIIHQSVEIKCMKTNQYLVRYSGDSNGQQQKADIDATWICDGKTLRTYSSYRRSYHEFKLTPDGKDMIIESPILNQLFPHAKKSVNFKLASAFPIIDLLTGQIHVEELMTRYRIELFKEDENYVYLRIQSKTKADQEEFEEMIIALFSPRLPKKHDDIRYLPALIKVSKNRNQEVEIWTFKMPRVNVKDITSETFKKRDLPPDWTLN